MKPKPATKLLILVIALAMITRARVALLPGWVVPAPAVLLAVMVVIVAALATVVMLRLCPPRPARGLAAPSVPAPSGDAPAVVP